ncbi:MAG: right-handed parallel beta-helix repeat-containing protein [Candidatus Hydrogenedentes bacterium]|nr:right-handed parallel beta-helix repeat-containing protein [Candidatus Hydrogenedentota bacterium]
MRSRGNPRHFCFCCACALLAAFAAQADVSLFVSPKGNDAWSGRIAEPSRDGTDGPFATIQHARDVVRTLPKDYPIMVFVREGVYPVAEPIRFAPEDSGGPNGPVIYTAYRSEKPVLHGGRVVTGWTQDGGVWSADLPDVREGRWDFSALWVNGERRQPARTPNCANPAGDFPPDTDFFSIDGPVMELSATSGKEEASATKFRFREGDMQQWPGLQNAVFVVFHAWATSLLRVKNIDWDNRVVEFTGPARWPFARWRADQWYFIEHLREGLDAPGEWYLDRAAGKLYYMPMPGEDMNAAEVVAPVARQFLLVEGDAAQGEFVERIYFRGLRFEYGEWPIEPEGHSDAQAAFTVPGAIEMTGARSCGLQECAIAHVGTYAVWFHHGSKDCWMRQCEAFDLGGGGVRIGEGADPASQLEAAERNTVDNCCLHDGGRIFREAVGVWIGRSSYNRVSRNDVGDFRYSGMSVGWSWGYAPSSAHHNIIEYNHIHDIGKGQLGDMGGIYTLGISPGTVLRGNYIHDVLCHPKLYGGWGLYTDEGSSGIVLENNVVVHTRTGGFHQHYGKENIVRNNIFAFSETEQVIRSRQEEHISFFFENNIVYFSNGRLLGSNWSNGNYRMNRNVYWDTSGAEIEFAGKTFDEWRAAGFDTDSQIADPLFVDLLGGNFALQAESPALALGFRPINMDKVGLYGEAAWVKKAGGSPCLPFTPPAPPAPVSFADDFESTDIGAVANVATTNGEEGEAQIRVTDETAASGARSLKCVDRPGLAHAFNPHLVYQPGARAGVAVGKCALRIEQGTAFYIEWRDSREPYRVGPSLWFDGAGGLSVKGAPVANVPVGQWFRLEITCSLGRQANGAWDLKVTQTDGAEQVFPGLACGNPAFNRVDWLGFVAHADAPGVFYLDDISLEVK